MSIPITRRDAITCILGAGAGLAAHFMVPPFGAAHLRLGRKSDSLRTIAERSGVYIVACGGRYRKVRYPPDAFRKTADQIADDLVEQAHGAVP